MSTRLCPLPGWLSGVSALLLMALPGTGTEALEILSQPTPGGIVQIDIQRADLPRPSATFDGHQVKVVRHGHYWRAVIGIGLDTAPGRYRLMVQSAAPSGDRTIPFRIASKNYAVQRLRIADPNKVNPAERERRRIENESRRIRQARENWSEADLVQQFTVPVKGAKSSSFGLRRILNGQLKSPHGGMDIAAATGTPITAPAAGKVIDRGDFFYTGNTIMLDHGQGLISLYAHLHSFDVAVGVSVAAGQRIGRVGATGRVTGPHLHWAVALNGQWIDPELLLHSTR